MKTFDTPQKAVYLYKTPNFDGTFTVQQVKVLVKGENDKSYFVELLEFTLTRKPHETLWVRKRNVSLKSNSAPESKFWWQNM